MSAVIWSSIIMMHMPLSSLPLRPALPLICMYSPLDIHLQMFGSLFMAPRIITYMILVSLPHFHLQNFVAGVWLKQALRLMQGRSTVKDARGSRPHRLAIKLSHGCEDHCPRRHVQAHGKGLCGKEHLHRASASRPRLSNR